VYTLKFRKLHLIFLLILYSERKKRAIFVPLRIKCYIIIVYYKMLNVKLVRNKRILFQMYNTLGLCTLNYRLIDLIYVRKGTKEKYYLGQR